MGDEIETCRIEVVCRFRPFSDREKKLGLANASLFEIEQDRVTVTDESGEGKDPLVFPLACCLGPETSQEDVFNALARDSIADFLKGYNITLFAYGQTGAGKTYSMFGDVRQDATKGVIPRSCETVFRAVHNWENQEIVMTCSYIEIYMEAVGDLLSGSTDSLLIRESPQRGVYVEHLTWEYVTNYADLLRLVALGDARKVQRATKMNPQSSRSHCVLVLHLEKRDLTTHYTMNAKLNFVDLAGSERISKSGATGLALEEAKKINLSLTSLSQCIHALTDANRTHIPYRQSKLTRLLQDSLGGSSKTKLLIACSPHNNNLDETVSTLRFAKRCVEVRTTPKVNISLGIEELEALVESLTVNLNKIRAEKGYTRPEMLDESCQTGNVEEDGGGLEAECLDVLCAIELQEAQVAQTERTIDELKRELARKNLELSSLQEKLNRTAMDVNRRKDSTIRRQSFQLNMSGVVPSLPSLTEASGLTPRSIPHLQMSSIDKLQVEELRAQVSELKPDMAEQAQSMSVDALRETLRKAILSVNAVQAEPESSDSKLDKKVAEYERRQGQVLEQVQAEAEGIKLLRVRLDDQCDIMARQHDVISQLEEDEQRLHQVELEFNEAIEQSQARIKRLRQEIETTREGIRARKEAEEEERRRQAELENEGVLGGALNFFKGLF